jgi:hypothetical protein
VARHLQYPPNINEELDEEEEEEESWSTPAARRPSPRETKTRRNHFNSISIRLVAKKMAAFMMLKDQACLMK